MAKDKRTERLKKASDKKASGPSRKGGKEPWSSAVPRALRGGGRR